MIRSYLRPLEVTLYTLQKGEGAIKHLMCEAVDGKGSLVEKLFWTEVTVEQSLLMLLLQLIK